jgi:hypothetical protein
MKVLGRTPEGNFIVEMSDNEHHEFCLLQNAAEGHVPHFDNFQMFTNDLADVFRAIHLWCDLKFRVNGLLNAVNDLNEQLKEDKK